MDVQMLTYLIVGLTFALYIGIAIKTRAGWALLFIAIMYTPIPALAAFSRVNMIESVNGSDGKGVPHEQAANWLNSWEKLV